MNQGKRNAREMITLAVGVIMTAFYLITLVIYPLSPDIFRPLHMLLVSVMVLLSCPFTKGRRDFGIVDGIWLIAGIVTFTYALFQIEAVLERGGITTTVYDIIFGIIAILVVLETTRRTVGLALPIIAVVFLLYAFYGEYIPGVLGHTGYSVKRIITSIYTYDGIFGMATAVMATFVAMFIIFAEFLDLTGAGDAFLELSLSLAGGLRGGPAKIATLASAFFGSISGSAVANVASTGSFTIPLMKKIGYKPAFAAAVESAASTGGQFMPPIMAAGAFLMTEIVGCSYLEVIKAALIPALIYFVMIWVTIDFRSARRGLKGLSSEEIPGLKEVLRKNALTILPLLFLIVFLVVFQYSPITSAFYSLLLSLIFALAGKNKRPGIPDLVRTMSKAAAGIAKIAAACACAGIIIGVISLTGLGIKIATLIISLSGGKLLFALFFSMITAILFGMGLPTTVSYLLCVSVLAPVLIKLGIDALAANLFIFYFACLSGITPPVALAAYTGAGIAGGKPLETAFQACRLAMISFLLPYMFIYNDMLLMNGGLFMVMQAVFFAVVCCFALASVSEGWLYGKLANVYRLLMVVPVFFLISHKPAHNLLGLAVFVIILGIQVIKANKEKSTQIKEA
ncbi:MAG: TRAP transporter permease [Peptococcaceae bacterium]